MLGVKGQFDYHFACKVLAKAYVQFPGLAAAHNNEIDIIGGLSRHPNVVGLFDNFEDAKNIYIMVSYCAQGNLFDLLQKGDWQMPDSRIRVFLHHILSGLDFIHNHRIIHVDLKLENVFVNDKGFAQIGDFGLSLRFNRLQANADGEVIWPNRGTIVYMAWESVVRRVVSYKTDVWAFGVLAFLLKVGRLPFWAENEDQILDEIQNIRYL